MWWMIHSLCIIYTAHKSADKVHKKDMLKGRFGRAFQLQGLVCSVDVSLSLRFVQFYKSIIYTWVIENVVNQLPQKVDKTLLNKPFFNLKKNIFKSKHNFTFCAWTASKVPFQHRHLIRTWSVHPISVFSFSPFNPRRGCFEHLSYPPSVENLIPSNVIINI